MKILAPLLFAATLLSPEVMAQPRPGFPQPTLAQQGGPQHTGDARPSAAAKVSAEVMVIHATEDGAYMDPKLKDLQRHLQHLKYSSYRVLSESDLELTRDDPKKVEVEGGWDVSLTLIGVEGEKARFRVRVSSERGNLADITIAVARDRTFVVSGPQYEGGILLIPIKASF